MNRRTPSHAFTPMTLGNMRELGVRSLALTCELCYLRQSCRLIAGRIRSSSAPSGRA